MRIRTRFITAALAAALLLVVALTTYLHAQSSATTDVRIAARLLENGKVEFGLQQRGPTGWGERILPTKNKFPADAEVGRWLRSTPVTIGLPVDTESLGGWKYDAQTRSYRLARVGARPFDTDASDQLILSCGPYGRPFAGLSMNEHRPIDAVGNAGVSYRVEGSSTSPEARWVYGPYASGMGFATFPYDDAGFAAWMAVNYARSPLLHLTMSVSESLSHPYVKYQAAFDLTGLPAVLEKLPCFGIGG